MSNKRNQHVVPRTDGWAVRGERAERASGVFPTKAEATQAGRTIARNVGFQAGDIVREINGVTIRTKRDFETAVRKAEAVPGSEWRLAIERNGQRIETSLRG